MNICLKAIRSKMGLTQQQVADSIAITQPTYSNIECGRRRPSPETAKLLGSFFGISWTVFFEDEDEISK